MTSYHFDSVVRDLNLIRNRIPDASNECFTLKQNLQFLETFFVCARKWRNSGEMVSLQRLLSKIEVTANKHARNIQSLRRKAEEPIFDEVSILRSDIQHQLIVIFHKADIKSFKQEIIELYSNLAGFICSSQSNSCMGDEELVGFIDSILQNLVDLLDRWYFYFGDNYANALPAQIEALEDKLTLLKNFIRFAKLRGVQHNQFENLLIHTQIAALDAACLSYMCLFYGEDKEVHSLISDLLQKIKTNNLRICEIYIQVLGASNSPSRLYTEKMDKRVVQDFNDSIISCLWELLCGANFLVSVKGQMQILYEGLRFLRSILRKPHEKMDALTENIVALIGEAGIVICSLFVREVDVDSAVVTDSPDCCATLDSINSHIEHIKARISGLSVTGSVPSYHSFKGQEIHKTSRLMPSKGKIPVTHEVVVGFDKEAEILIARLVNGSKELEIIPIIGMPGLGKTTLAKKVYNSPKTLDGFHCHLWCTVSQVYSKKTLLLQILRSDGKHSRMNESFNNPDEHELLDKLRKNLMKKRYLAVFDDVWDVRVWDDLRHAFPNEKNGSRILFTSRISDVASQVECAREPHNLRPLNDGESWELIQKKVFGKGDCPQALHEIGKKIAKICKGLPLTVVTVAGILASIEYDDWDEFAESLTSTTVNDTDQCRNTVELSYMHLPHYLKPCLLYFGAFREDEEIQSKKLMWLWIAEGLVQNTDPKRLEDLAEEYMLDLIGRNLVMVAKQRSRGEVKACQIHDLILEFCRAKANEENFLQVLHGYDELSTFNVPRNLRRLSIWSKVDHFKKSRIFCPHLSSLLLFNESEKSDALADVSFIFCIYKGLRVLDLEQIFLHGFYFPREVESLVELRYLAVEGAEVDVITRLLVNSPNLETLAIRYPGFRLPLPEPISNMTKLRHLHLDSGFHLPRENLESNSCWLSLDTLSTLIVAEDEKVENISRKIRNVRQQKIELDVAKESTTANDYNFSELESLESLELSATMGDFLQNHVEFAFPSNLKKLVLEKLGLPWSKITLIEKLPNLEVLKLHARSFKGEKWELTEGGFLKLRFLSLRAVDVVQWTYTGSDDPWNDPFPYLQKLRLKYISELESVPSCLERISNLEVIEVWYCRESVKDLVRKIEEEQQSYANENLKVLIVDL